MICKSPHQAFTLLELLVVVAVITVLATTLLPSLAASKELARTTTCLTNLHALGVSMSLYHTVNREMFWPCKSGSSYFWGTATVPVDTKSSPLLAYCDMGLKVLWCPSLPWGGYVPQGRVQEPTTTYGYNAWCLDPAFWGKTDEQGHPLPPKRVDELKNPSELFVFADSGMFWKPAGVSIFQNSTSLDPVTLGSWGPNMTPTTHFRHLDRANALTADGKAESFGPEGGQMLDWVHKLGFVGASNVPHYDQ
jgi:prepilin-type N-terminal cleavage/methylation domain-containing protein